MSDSDKFSLHQEFPLDQTFINKALERGFPQGEIQNIFEEWRSYWAEQRPDKESTPRGWLQNWDGHLKRKAVRRAKSAKPSQPPPWRRRFEEKQQSLPAHKDYRMFPISRALAAKKRMERGEALDKDDMQALMEWNMV